ncbi:MAG: endonuclease/exonuclease/phosphatase family protein [Planctomycetota bacterium]|nr:endonuclease/exonuclease/phosphatase family protein [Planctomycetota bacterium]
MNSEGNASVGDREPLLPPRDAVGRSVVGWLAVFAAGFAAFVAAAVFILGRIGTKPIEALASPWTAHGFAVLVVSLAVLLLCRAWRAAIVLSPIVIWAGVVTVPVISASSSFRADPAASFRAVSMNVGQSEGPSSAVMEWLSTTDADLVGLIECHSRWARAVHEMGSETVDLSPRWASVIIDSDDRGTQGIALFSRFPLHDVVVEQAPGGRGPHIKAIAQTSLGAVRVVLVHPMAPLGPTLTRLRNDELDWLSEDCAATPLPTLVMGDFNETPFGRAYGRFAATTGYRAGWESGGYEPTWPTILFGISVPQVLGISIDHAFVSPDLVPVSFKSGPAFGPDHRPIVIDVARDALTGSGGSSPGPS